MSNVTYNNTEKLRFWCQKVLPLVYDDSLSYYELLNKMVVYLNSTIEDVQAMIADVTSIEQALSSKIDLSQKGVANGVATLNGQGQVPLAQLPDLSAGVQTISVNGVNVPADDNKNVNIIVMTNAVSNLVNYYLKSETYNKTEVNALIDNVKNSRFEVVAELPTSDIQTNVIYLVPKSVGQTQNGYDEFINLDGTTSGWELIGSTDIDLSGYVTDTELATTLSAYVTTQSLNTTLAGYVTNGTLASTLEGYVTTVSFESLRGTVVSQGNTLAGLITTVNGKVDKVAGKGLSTNDYTNEDKAIVNGVTSALAGKVDKVEGKGLSTNDYTNADKAVVTTAQDNIKANTKLIKDTVGWSGKNKLPYPYKKTFPWVNRGITFSDENGKGTIKINGTNDDTDNSNFALFGAWSNIDELLPAGNYIFSTGNNNSDIRVQVIYNETSLGIGSGTFSVNAPNGISYINLFVNKGATITNELVYPMLRNADILDDTYEPYFGSTAVDWASYAKTGVHQWFNPNNVIYGASFATVANKGASITIKNETAGSYAQSHFKMVVAPNTDYKLRCAVDYSSGKGLIIITDEATGNVELVRSSEMSADGNIELSFNSGNNDAIIVKMFSTRTTSEIGEITYNNTLLSLASDTVTDFDNFVMTNKELTENVFEKRVLTSTDSLNDIKETGLYKIQSSSPIDAPEGITWCSLLVNKVADLNVQQQITQGSTIYQRVYSGNPASWGNWYKFTGSVVS